MAGLRGTGWKDVGTGKVPEAPGLAEHYGLVCLGQGVGTFFLPTDQLQKEPALFGHTFH